MSSVVIVCHLLYVLHASLWYPNANISFLRHYNTALDVSYVTIFSFEPNTTFVARSLARRENLKEFDVMRTRTARGIFHRASSQPAPSGGAGYSALTYIA